MEKYNLKIIRIKRFVLIIILLAILLTFSSILLAVVIKSIIPIFFIFPFIIICFIFTQRKTSKEHEIIIDANFILIGEVSINKEDILGYYIDENVSLTNLSVKLTSNEVLNFCFNNIGKTKQDLNKFLSSVKKANSNIESLTYQEVNIKQMKFLRPLIFMLLFVLVIMDVTLLYLYIKNGITLNYKILYIHVLLIGLIPLLKHRK